MSNHRYVLDEDGDAVAEPDLTKWAQWFENTENRIVKQTVVGDKEVSTVFLGIDYSFERGKDHAPLLFETKVFMAGTRDEEGNYDYMNRYETRAEALLGHEATVKQLSKSV